MLLDKSVFQMQICIMHLFDISVTVYTPPLWRVHCPLEIFLIGFGLLLNNNNNNNKKIGSEF